MACGVDTKRLLLASNQPLHMCESAASWLTTCVHDLQDLAKKKKIKTLGVSMGQGQEIIARKYMASATVEGQWVLLQNTHLGLGYLTEVCHLHCPLLRLGC